MNKTRSVEIIFYEFFSFNELQHDNKHMNKVLDQNLKYINQTS